VLRYSGATFFVPPRTEITQEVTWFQSALH